MKRITLAESPKFFRRAFGKIDHGFIIRSCSLAPDGTQQAVAVVAPAGGGKSKHRQDMRVEGVRKGLWLGKSIKILPGTWLARSHDLIREQVSRIRVRHVTVEGTARRAARDAKKMGDVGWSAFLKKLESRGWPIGGYQKEWRILYGLGPDIKNAMVLAAATRGGTGQTGSLVFGPHAIAHVLPDLPTPYTFDEAPPFVDSVTIPIADIEFQTGHFVDARMEEWARNRRPAARIILKAAQRAIEEFKKLPPEKTRYPIYLWGSSMAELFRAAGFTVSKIHAARSANAEPEVTPSGSVAPRPPSPPLDDVLAQSFEPENWPRMDICAALDTVLHEVLAGWLNDDDTEPKLMEALAWTTPQPWPKTYTRACLVISRYGEGVRVHLLVSRPWPIGIQRQTHDNLLPQVIFLDATASILSAAYDAAWAFAGYKVTYRSVKIQPRDSTATTRTLISTRSLSRSRLFYPPSPRKNKRKIQERAPGAIERWLRACGAEMMRWRQKVGLSRPLIVAAIVYMPLQPLMEIAYRKAFDEGTLSKADSKKIVANGLQRIVNRLRGWRNSGIVGEIRWRHQGAVRGHNDLKDADCALLLPAIPNIGMARFEADVLEIYANEYISSLAAAETYQEAERLRTLWATADTPKCIIYAGRNWHEAWGPLDRTVTLPHGGRVPREPSDLVRYIVQAACQTLPAIHVHGILAMMQDTEDRVPVVPDTTVINTIPTNSNVRHVQHVIVGDLKLKEVAAAIRGLSPRTIRRIVRDEAMALGAKRVVLPDPTRDRGGQWVFWEMVEGGAEKVWAEIRQALGFKVKR